MVRCLDTNDEEDWAVAEVKALQEDVKDQEYHTRDSNISMLYLIKDHDCNIHSWIANLLNINWHLLFVSGLGQCYDTTFAIYMVLGPAPVLKR